MLQDLRYAVRTFVGRPSFTVIALLTLAIGIGANVAIFSIVEGVLLRPLPLTDPERLVVIWDTHPALPVPFMAASPPRIVEWRRTQSVFEEVGGFVATQMTISDGGAAEQVNGAAVYQGLLPALGVQPASGRFFSDEEYLPEAPRVVILSDALWRRRFAADRAVIGRSVPLGGYPYLVVGVMPASFNFVPSVTIEGKPPLARPDFLIPQRVADPNTQWGAHYLTAIGRLRPGVTIDSARRQMKDVAARLVSERSEEKGWSVEVVPLLAQATGALRPTLLTLLAAVSSVLLLACTNVANLLLARGVGRRRELAIRAALGASRGRLARQLLTEAAVLGGAGGALGLLVASWCVRFARAYGPASITRLDEVRIDPVVLAFTIGISLVAAALFGMAPLAQLARPRAVEALRERTGSGGVALRGALVVIEVSLAMVMLVGGVLLMEGFFRLAASDPGFRPDHARSFRVALPPGAYENRTDRTRFVEETVKRLASQPGIQSAGAIDSVPIAENRQGTDISVDGAPEPAGTDAHAGFSFPTAGYFEAIGVPLLRGRTFSERDRADSPPVIVINQTVARRLFGAADPIGRHMRAGFNHQIPREVVGVVGDERHTGLGRAPAANVYVPYSQVNWAGAMSFVMRSTVDASAATSIAREAIRAVDPGAAIYGMRTLDDVVSQSIAAERFAAALFAAFAAAALALALVGIYGVTDQAVSQRTHELGVRIALGADRRRIRYFVLGGSLRLSVIGIVIGMLLASMLSRLLVAQLFGVSPFEPRAYAGVVTLLIAACLAAAYLPARRATRVDPMIALRAE